MSFHTLFLCNSAGLLGDGVEAEDSQKPGSETKKGKKVKETDNEARAAHPETSITSWAHDAHPPRTSAQCVTPRGITKFIQCYLYTHRDIYDTIYNI